jgi:phospholipid/cholesterol/gamma-HCH transport system permease protein
MPSWLETIEPRLTIDPARSDCLLATGDWTFQHAESLLTALKTVSDGIQAIDARAINRLDATGTQILLTLLNQQGLDDSRLTAKPEHQALFRAVLDSSKQPPAVPTPPALPTRILSSVGYWVSTGYANSLLFLSFLGQTLVSFLATVARPKHWRITSTVFHMQSVGLNAVPLVMLLSFMVGAVIAFLGATVLSEFGAELWVVELVGVSFMREFGVMLTAILLAGRTASAFTAQIGSMKSGEELDALKTMGLDPIELLVLPRITALLVTLPLLAFLATMAGLLGGMAVCNWTLGISPEMFMSRLNSELAPRHIWIGLSKAPVFAVVIGLIGCLEGFKCKSNAQSVGEHTTSSVVQSISLVILLDALAAMFYMELDL